MHTSMNRLIALLMILSACANAYAEDLGIKAQTYPLDRDAREVFKDIVRQKQRTGELDQFWQNYQAKTIASIKQPAPLGIKSDYTVRQELRDLRFVMARDMHNEKGQRLVKAGTVVEPLKIQPLVSGLIFIDGRDPQQVDYAIAQGRKQPLKIVLTAGSPYDLRVQYQGHDWWGGKTIPFYFDQRKMIISTLKRLYGIDVNAVPVMLTQRGDQLAVAYGM